MHIHVLGICGTFMGGIAALALEAGYRVTGCDTAVYPPMSDQLRKLGIEVIEGFDISQLKLKPDVFVIGNVVSRGNLLMEAILEQGLPYISGPQWLSEKLLQGRHVLAVAGTHGKTTTSAMLAWILEYGGYQPGFLIGGLPTNFNATARLGKKSGFFIIEADEYDTAFFDKRSKFVHYRPRTLILNNLEFDHADIFENLSAIQTQCHHLIRTIPSGGRVIINAQSPPLQAVLDKGCWTPVVRFNCSDGWHTKTSGVFSDVKNTVSFDVFENETQISSVNWSVLGTHNQSNALAALLAADHIGMDIPLACEALHKFSGVKRRLEVHCRAAGIKVYDDFAHHPTAIGLTLKALRQQVGSDLILAVFEPRSNTMKQGIIKDLLPSAFVDADMVFCYAKGITWDVQATMSTVAKPVIICWGIESLVNKIIASSKPGAHILVMSNGGFEGIHQRLFSALDARYAS